jgi:hypothetical protein
MRRASRLAVAVFAFAALALPAVAVAKSADAIFVRPDSGAAGLRVGKPWNLKFTVLFAQEAKRWQLPAVWIARPGSEEPAATFAARSTGRPYQYEAWVTFPAAGTWAYTVGERNGRFFDFGPVTVGVAAAKGGKRSALLGATPIAAVGLCAALGFAALVRRRRPAG